MNLLDPFCQQQTLAYGLANSQQYEAAQQMAMLANNVHVGTLGKTPLYRSIKPARQMTGLEVERFNRAGLLRRA